MTGMVVEGQNQVDLLVDQLADLIGFEEEIHTVDERTDAGSTEFFLTLKTNSVFQIFSKSSKDFNNLVPSALGQLSRLKALARGVDNEDKGPNPFAERAVDMVEARIKKVLKKIDLADDVRNKHLQSVYGNSRIRVRTGNLDKTGKKSSQNEYRLTRKFKVYNPVILPVLQLTQDIDDFVYQAAALRSTIPDWPYSEQHVPLLRDFFELMLWIIVAKKAVQPAGIDDIKNVSLVAQKMTKTFGELPARYLRLEAP